MVIATRKEFFEIYGEVKVMILADKIIRLRKKNGWSQEELANKMNVSRQAVSKWEGAQSIPDIEKVLQMSELFGVTTDYLLKDEMEEEEFTEDVTDRSVRKVSLSEAHEYLAWRKRASIGIAVATYLCIFAVIPLLLLGVATSVPAFALSENMAGGLGMVLLFLLVAPAVAVFVVIGIKNAPYEFFEKEIFETEYGVSGMVRERQKKYRKNYMRNNTIGTCLCVLSPVALFIGAFSGNEFFTVIMLAVTMLIAGAGAMFFIVTGVRWAAMQKLLKEGEFSDTEKVKGKGKGAITLLYWSLATAIYLIWIFVDYEKQNWNSISWIVWPVAGVLFAGVLAACNAWMDRKNNLDVK